MIEQITIFSAILFVLVTLRLLRHRIRYWSHLLMEQGWKSSIHYDRCYRIFTKLYEDTSPVSLSMTERREKGLENDSSLTYGEVNFYSFVQILELAAPKEGEIFYDLGSGAGKAVFIAGLVFDFTKVCGVEKLDSLYQMSTTALDKLWTLPQLKELHGKKMNFQFIHDDLLTVDFSEASIVFLQATCFYGPIWDQLMVKLLMLKVGTRVIITTRKLEIGGFKLNNKNQFLMSWGLCTVSIYERV